MVKFLIQSILIWGISIICYLQAHPVLESTKAPESKSNIDEMINELRNEALESEGLNMKLSNRNSLIEEPINNSQLKSGTNLSQIVSSLPNFCLQTQRRKFYCSNVT